ncbi:JmjC domain, hydroxylase-domain-containing protein, partial [Absidia repens]
MKRISTRSTTAIKTDHRSQPLDLSTVRTTNEKIPRTRKRIFGLQEAPIYYPTTEEFKDPIQYIQKIKPEAEQYGIIKIVPPKEYEPGFCLNTEIFRFRTRIQKMNSMEGATRANLNYLDKVQKFHRVLHGKPISRIPVLDKRPIDLYRLKNDVAEKGGFQKVCDEKQWAEIGRSMGYSRQQCTSMSNALKKAYMQIVMPYEHWLAKHKARRSTPLRKDTNDENSDNEPSQELCEICREEGNDDNLVVCDDCDRAYHIFCVEPPLATVPSHEWYCIDCLTGASGDYGFEDGGEYSLPEFHAFCDKFKKRWFSKEKPVKNPDVVAEEDCEDEFWRLVDNPHETCEVEYGADLHSNHHGSGFAPIERGPDGVKGDDPWNLNMIPVLPSSLFTHIKTDISGMMVPWLYIGMCFSAFCWHNEDHFTYSINYMHWGETKTWYGVPGEDTTKFEDTMKKAVPELFEQQPNLLFQLVTMLSPGRLLKEKVRVYAVDQRPGEFVVTFPKAYHSGFNHGFNFCEAVNFAPVDWLHYGLECAKRYKDHRRQPCFSHDELLVNIAKMEVPSENVKWIKAAVSDMEQRELGDRKRFKQQHPSIKQQLSVTKDSNDILFSNDLDQEHLQCLACHCYTYLSYVTCPCTKKVACFEHFDELCKCKESSKLVHLRFSEDELHSLVEMAGGKGNHPSEWLRRAKARLSDDNLTTEEALRMQLKEAKTEGVSKYYTWEMERTLASLKEWEAQASTLLD